MATIQNILDSLQPYVIGIRYLEGTPLVDVVFKDGWTVIEDNNIKRVKGNNELNYFMIFSEVDGVGLDELLQYVEKVIKLNQEREKKHDLLKNKVNELKEIFKRNSLLKLSKLKFIFDDEFVPDLDEMDIDFKEEEIVEEIISEPQPPVITHNETPKAFLDEDGNVIEPSEEDKELIEEEERAALNRKMIASKKAKPVAKIKTPELQHKPKLELVTDNNYYDCDCGPDSACEKCIDKKDF